ncbi:hypothetical protein D3C87_640650 [compost metagenome]
MGHQYLGSCRGIQAIVQLHFFFQPSCRFLTVRQIQQCLHLSVRNTGAIANKQITDTVHITAWNVFIPKCFTARIHIVVIAFEQTVVEYTARLGISQVLEHVVLISEESLWVLHLGANQGYTIRELGSVTARFPVRSSWKSNRLPYRTFDILSRVGQRPTAHPVRSRQNAGFAGNSRLRSLVLIPKSCFFRDIALVIPFIQFHQTLLHSRVNRSVFQLAVCALIPLLRNRAIGAEDPGRVTHPCVHRCLESNTERNNIFRLKSIWILVLESVHNLL